MYANKIILAPMVRIGTLPTRLLALDYGADLVYTEEIIDWKLLRSKRRENEVLGTVDYIDLTDGTVVFRTCSAEKSRVILQIGTSDPDRASKVAKLVENDVAGIDINMGCPKEFSLKGGMGAALLYKPEKAEDILRKVISSVKCPVTCKIRVLESLDETLQLCKRFESCGIAAIAVHGRTKFERQQHSNRIEFLQMISKSLSIPVIANGGSKEIETFEDILSFKEKTKCSSVMIARAAEWNVSVFSPYGKKPLDDMIKAYLKYAVDYDNSPSNTKYCIQNMLRELQDTEKGKKFLETQTLQQICDLWDMQDYYEATHEKQQNEGLIGRRDVCPVNYQPPCNEIDIVEMEISFLRSLYPRDPDLPKSKLLIWTKSQGYKIPLYETKEKNKRWAEQGAALVCLCSVGVLDSKKLKRHGILR
ncbi:tRNA-dihydrouridine(20) synthase [NAD(P)+]-like isoform X2 [Halyomorpha halys]|uniref:tRNA-dihydrouridine(20) synthase [NAD(P)+]-like isoform X2 n=1 Tax=Halyomorpha halys TaxID=286706 RepID=UPI0034D206B0